MYKQSSHFTNLATSLMFVINSFRPEFKLTKENEYSLWIRTVNLPLKSSSIYAIAHVAKETGIPVKLFVGDKEFSFPNYRFRGYKKIEIEEADYVSSLYRKKAEESGVEIVKQDFDFAFVKKLLQKKSIVLVRVNMGIIKGIRAVSQYLAVFSCADGKFTVLDPEHGEKQQISEQVLREAFETLEQKCHRDHRMVAFG